MGFPPDLTVDFCNDPNFPPDAVFASAHNRRQIFDVGPSQVVLRVDESKGSRVRYVRVRANRLAGNRLQSADEDEISSSPQQDSYVFALAELQVIEHTPEAKNIAFGCAVTTSDGDELQSFANWSPSALTDGYASQGRLVTERELLPALVERIELEAERDRRADSLERYAQSRREFWTMIALLASVGAALALLLIVVRQRKRETKKIHDLRQQIARDLHDEVGSALATIRISSELAADSVVDVDEAREDFVRIRDQAREAGNSMREIVWLIDSSRASSQHLVDYMQRLAKTMLVGCNVGTHEEQTWSCPSIPIETRRAAISAFKETLTNILKHAQATQVEIWLRVDYRKFSFVVADDGIGLESWRDTVDNATSQTETSEVAGAVVVATPSQVAEFSGKKITHGLSNLVARAVEAGGECRIEPSTNGGTQVSWSIKIL